MRNKLKNILKFGIYHKRLSLRQLVLFFRSLGYDIVNIVDPSCFVLKEPRQGLMTDIGTQELHDDSHPDIDHLPIVDPRDKLNKQLLGTKHIIQGERPDHKRSSASASGSGRGGTKRKRSYSRKRRTRRKRCVTRRYRRRRS
jgi:hypothetical protein